MYNVKLYNKISKVGLNDLDAAKYTCSEDFTDYDAVLVRSAKLHEVEFPKDLKCIARAGAGVNNIPIDRCSQEGIVVFNTPGANANAVKELVICALLLASRKVVQGANWVKGLKGTPDIGPAAEKGKSTYAGPEIAGKKLGIIGLGAIGVQVANSATHLGMEVLGYDPYISVEAAWNLSRNIRHITNVDDIYKECDYITIHVPLLDSTKGMINAEAIEKMKDGVVVLNYARDLLVDEKAMVDALKKAGVTDEQIEKAKYTALGASEVAQETAEKTARDLQAIARIKSREFRKDAARRADEMKAQAREQMGELQKKTEEMKRQSEIQSQQMKLKSDKLKAQARVQMQEAKIQANKLKIQAQEQAETAQAKAQEISDRVVESAGRYRAAAMEAASQAKAGMKSTAEEYRAKIEERARQKQAEAAERDGKSVEGAGKAEETAASPDEKTKGE